MYIYDRLITVYNRGEHARDFTYINDIVGGVISSLSMKTTSPAVVNLGNEKPIKLMDFVKQLKSMWASLHYTGPVKGDVPMTYSNI